jgi:hypothetical protein
VQRLIGFELDMLLHWEVLNSRKLGSLNHIALKGKGAKTLSNISARMNELVALKYGILEDI